MHGYIGFIPRDGFYLKLVCEETNPLRTYTKANDPVYQDSAMEVFLMFDSEGEKAHKGVYINLEMNSNGAFLQVMDPIVHIARSLQMQNMRCLNARQRFMKRTGR